MRRVAIVGAGQSRFGDFPGMSIKELFAEAYAECAASVDRGLSPKAIDAVFLGTLGTGGFQLGQPAALLASHVGLAEVPSVRLENACASGGFALLSAVYAVCAGVYRTVLVAGVEKMRDLSADHVRYWLGVSGDTEYERLAGLTFAGIYAMMARHYLSRYDVPRIYLSKVAEKNHAHGVLNKKAHLRRQISLEEAQNAPMVADPLNLFDCSPTSDGAACVLISSEDYAARFTDRPVWVLGYGAGGDHLALHDRRDWKSLVATRDASKRAYEMAGLGPTDIDLAEVHDCFTIAELLAYEDLGFCNRGEAPSLLDKGITRLGGSLPVNLSGGLKSKGHPLGATGVAQVVEMFLQLRGQAGDRQASKHRTGLTHNVGGSGGTAVVFILGRDLD